MQLGRRGDGEQPGSNHGRPPGRDDVRDRDQAPLQPGGRGRHRLRRDIGEPGEYPYTRGPYPHMYRQKLWTMRQYTGFGTVIETNAWNRQAARGGRRDGALDRPRPADPDGLRLRRRRSGRPRSDASAWPSTRWPTSRRSSTASRSTRSRARSRSTRPRSCSSPCTRSPARSRACPPSSSARSSRTTSSRSTSRAAPACSRSSRACASWPTRSSTAPSVMPTGEPDLGLQLPHPRLGLDRRAGDGVRDLQRPRVRRPCARQGASRSTTSLRASRGTSARS